VDGTLSFDKERTRFIFIVQVELFPERLTLRSCYLFRDIPGNAGQFQWINRDILMCPAAA
jgi:hypothetical protein